MRVLIERAGARDIPALVELMQRFYAESSHSLDPDWAARSFQRLLGDDGVGGAWVARKDAEAVGYVVLTLRHSMEFGGRVAYIDDLFVLPDSRRQGIASALLRALFAACRALSVAAIHVEVGTENVAALALYQAFGLGSDGHVVLTVRLQSAAT